MEEKLFGDNDDNNSKKLICLIAFIIISLIFLITAIIFGALYSIEKNKNSIKTLLLWNILHPKDSLKYYQD